MAHLQPILLFLALAAAGLLILDVCRSGRRLRAIHRQYRAALTDRERRTVHLLTHTEPIMPIYDGAQAFHADTFRPPRPGSYTPAEAPIGLDADPVALEISARRYGGGYAAPQPHVYHHAMNGSQVQGTPDHISRRRQLVGQLITAHREAAHRWAEAASLAHARATQARGTPACRELRDAGLLAEGASAHHLRQITHLRAEMTRLYGGAGAGGAA